MSDISRKQMTATLEGLLSTQEDTTRIMAAACLGALCQCLPEDELSCVLSNQLLGKLRVYYKEARKSMI